MSWKSPTRNAILKEMKKQIMFLPRLASHCVHRHMEYWTWVAHVIGKRANHEIKVSRVFGYNTLQTLQEDDTEQHMHELFQYPQSLVL
jgi:hypothetical protein